MLPRYTVPGMSGDQAPTERSRLYRHSVNQRNSPRCTAESGGDASVLPDIPTETEAWARCKLEFYGGSEDDAADVLLLVDNAEDALLRWSKRKGFILWFVFFILYCIEQMILCDTAFGHQTLAVYSRARESHDLPDFVSLSTDLECEHYITHELEEIIEYSYELCPKCHVAIASKSSDMHILTMADFVCSDWTIDITTAHYPPRDCHAADDAWRANPTAHGAPCCDDPELVLASIALMAAYKEHGIETETIEHLTNLSAGGLGNEEIHAYVDHHIDSDNFLLQLIISRDERMVGVMYTAERVDADHQPHLVDPSTSYWSFNYYAEAEGHTAMIAAWMYLAWFLSLIHELSEVYAASPTTRQVVRGAMRSSYFMLIEIPSFVLPVVQKAASSVLEVNTVLILSCAAILIGATRTFQEAGEVIPQVRLIVQTFSNAFEQTVGFLMVALPAMALLGFVQSLLFGIFMADYADFKHAYAQQFSIFQGGASIDDETREHAPVGTELMYYAAPFVLYLVMSQFLIAIFVGAFDETREQIDLEEQEQQRRFEEQRDNVVLVPPIPWRQRVAGIVYFAITWQSPWGGGTMAHALREVYRFNMHFEDDNTFNFDRTVVEKSDVRARAAMTVCSRKVLEQHMSAKQADGLLRWFGCRVVGPAGVARLHSGSQPEQKEALPFVSPASDSHGSQDADSRRLNSSLQDNSESTLISDCAAADGSLDAAPKALGSTVPSHFTPLNVPTSSAHTSD